MFYEIIRLMKLRSSFSRSTFGMFFSNLLYSLLKAFDSTVVFQLPLTFRIYALKSNNPELLITLLIPF